MNAAKTGDAAEPDRGRGERDEADEQPERPRAQARRRSVRSETSIVRDASLP